MRRRRRRREKKNNKTRGGHLGTILGRFWRVLKGVLGLSESWGASWAVLPASSGVLAPSRGVLGSLGGILEGSWQPLGVSWGCLGRSWAHLGVVLEQLGRFLACLETILCHHGSLEAVLGALRWGAGSILDAVLGGQNRSGATLVVVSELLRGELY